MRLDPPLDRADMAWILPFAPMFEPARCHLLERVLSGPCSEIFCAFCAFRAAIGLTPVFRSLRCSACFSVAIASVISE
jgi:hypothetical protein